MRIPQQTIGGFWWGKQIYLRLTALTHNQLDRLGFTPLRESLERERESATWLRSPAMWVACRDLSWQASCAMRQEQTLAWWLIYTVVAVLSVWTNMCLLWIKGWNLLRSRSTTNNSRQFICQCSRGPSRPGRLYSGCLGSICCNDASGHLF